jgi:ABC-type lipoprotein release transport system permease subunit
VTIAIRLGLRDLRRRTAESVLLLVAITVAATTLTIGLLLHGQTATPYAETKAATRGPDVVAAQLPDPPHPLRRASLRALRRLLDDPAVVATSGLVPTTWTRVRAGTVRGVAEIQGRSRRASAVDRPQVVTGTWVRAGGVVVERAFAQALDVRVGDRVRLGGRSVPVVGIAVSAALPPYPQLCYVGCILDHPSWHSAQPGLAWTTGRDATRLSNPREPLSYFLYLRLGSSRDAPAFVARHAGALPLGPGLFPWQQVARHQAKTLQNERTVVLFGSSLLIVLALATSVVLVAGRMADEVRRVGTLKALGASPGLVVRMLLTSYLTLGLVASPFGLLAGRLIAPLLVTPSAGLLGSPGATSVRPADIAVVLGTMLAIIVLASTIPAWRAARTSTVRALADAGRAPRRSGTLIRLSSQLPAPGLLGVRLTARRPRRAILTTCSIAVAVCAAVVVIFAQAGMGAESGPSGGPADPTASQLSTVMLAVTILLGLMAAVNLVFVTRSVAVDARRTLAVVRALGASPGESASALVLAQVVPVLAGLVLGTSAGVLLYRTLAAHPVTPSAWAWAVVGLSVVIGTGLLTAVPARLEARRSVADVLRDA